MRVDGSVALGSGHVMRCLTLAHELAGRGALVSFVCRDHPGNLIERIEHEGFAVARLPRRAGDAVSADSHELGAPEVEDAAEFLAAVGSERPDWIVTDHYGVADSWERHVGQLAKILVIDDYGRDHDAAVVLNQNWLGEDRGFEQHGATVKLNGPRFALLRPEYAMLRRVLPERGSDPRRVLIFFGGSDPSNETGKALQALSAPQFAHLAADVVLGANHPDPLGIRRLVEARPGSVLHANLPSLAALMVRADIAIGAGGATTWERLCLDLPSLVTIVADNQDPGASALAARGAIVLAGRTPGTSVESYRAGLVQLVRSAGPDRLVDGMGAQRVAEILMPSAGPALRLRRARVEDAQTLLDWRNEPATRVMSLTTAAIGWAEHIRWFRSRLQSGRSEILLLQARELPVGQVRFDLEPDHAVLSYSLDPIVRGRGWSRWLVSQAVQRLRESHPGVIVRAQVKPENTASTKVFTGLGWTAVAAPAGLLAFESRG